MADAYACWRAELKTPTPDADRLRRPTDLALLCGFWRIDSARMKPDHPVAIWPQDGANGPAIFVKIGVGARDGESLFNTINDEARVDDFLGSTWLKCIAVEEGVYHQAMLTGRWPDNKPARQMSDTEKLDLVPDTPPAEGGNNPVGEDGQPLDLFHQQVTDKIEAALEKAQALKFPITTMEDAQKGAEIIETLTGLGKQGEAKRKLEKQVWLDGAAAVDLKWSPVRAASEMIAKLKAVIETFKRAETARLQREQAERDAAERERIAEEARKEAERHGQPVDEAEIAQHVEEQIAAAPPPVVEPVRVSTAHGRAISSPKVKTATITDLVALATHLATVKDADLIEYLQKRANAAARAKITLPGTRIDP